MTLLRSYAVLMTSNRSSDPDATVSPEGGVVKLVGNFDGWITDRALIGVESEFRSVYTSILKTVRIVSESQLQQRLRCVARKSDDLDFFDCGPTNPDYS